MKLSDLKISIIGLGYVGLPIFINFSRKFNTIGYDINSDKIKDLKNGIDITDQFDSKTIIKNKEYITNDIKDLFGTNIFIIAVPTPIKFNKLPELKFLVSASKIVGGLIKKKTIVIYESTVFPGCTEDICIPILEKASGMNSNKDFFVAYSPERINPGDKNNTFEKIDKLISSQNLKISKYLSKIYSMVIKAKTHIVEDIKTAEAAKIIENTQRDVNIALINELMRVFDRMNINIHRVIKAASTKWNFNLYNPGLVGGHCIGVDPYYLTYAAKKKGINPKIILSGRKVNESIPSYLIKSSLDKFSKTKINKLKILVMGLTFKENCPDFRNSKSLLLANKLSKFSNYVFAYDPYFYKSDKSINIKSSLKVTRNLSFKIKFDLVFILLAHNEFKNISYTKYKNLLKKDGFLYDFKNIFNKNQNSLYQPHK